MTGWIVWSMSDAFLVLVFLVLSLNVLAADADFAFVSQSTILFRRT